MSELFFVSRPMCASDTKRVLEIEKAVFGDEAMPRRVLKAVLADENVFGHVVRDCDTDEILGYVIIYIHKREIEIVRLAVAPEHQQQGIGTHLIQYVIIERSKNIRALTIMVRERNLQAQMFLKHLGFECVGTMPNYYEDKGETGYFFTLGD